MVLGVSEAQSATRVPDEYEEVEALSLDSLQSIDIQRTAIDVDTMGSMHSVHQNTSNTAFVTQKHLYSYQTGECGMRVSPG